MCSMCGQKAGRRRSEVEHLQSTESEDEYKISVFDLPLVENDSVDATKRFAGSDMSPDEILSSAAPRVASRGLQLEICAGSAP